MPSMVKNGTPGDPWVKMHAVNAFFMHPSNQIFSFLIVLTGKEDCLSII
jgi:hypothetical protein